MRQIFLAKTIDRMKPQIGQEISLTVERLGINGEGVGYWQGFTIFVDGALPNEAVQARLYEVRKNFGRAKLLSLQSTSSHRVDPICPLFGKCGGCQLMHFDYAQQLQFKRDRVKDALERIGKLKDLEILSCMPSPTSLGYRNKIQLPAISNQGSLRLGLYAHNTHDLVEIDECFIHCDLGDKAYRQIKGILKNSSLPAYNPQTGEGVLRHVLMKTAVNTNQILVVLVTHGKGPDSIETIAQQIIREVPEVKGVIQNVNVSEGNVILSREFHTLAGESAIEEKLCDLTFKVSPASFFQVNPAQAEKLYEKVLEFAQLTGKERVLDAYCGVGTIALILAAHAKEVIGVECVSEAIADAEENAKRNQISHAQFVCATAETFINTLQEVDVAVLNPPRKGCELSFLEQLAILHPKRIVYISCDPATLARDLAILSEKDYRAQIVQPFDMFPQTAHVECIVQLVTTR